MATYYDVFYVKKDITKPLITNNMAPGSDGVWHSTGTAKYDV
jgi:hypothetical protein